MFQNIDENIAWKQKSLRGGKDVSKYWWEYNRFKLYAKR